MAGTLAVALLVVLEPADAQSPLERDGPYLLRPGQGLLRNAGYSRLHLQHPAQSRTKQELNVFVFVFNINDSSSSQGLSYFTLMASPQRRCCCDPYFTDENTEAQRRGITYLSHS